MAILVLDSSAVAVGKAPNDGFSLQLTEVEGLPSGLQMMIPFEGNIAQEVYDAIGAALGKKVTVPIATPSEMAQEVNRGGHNPPE